MCSPTGAPIVCLFRAPEVSNSAQTQTHSFPSRFRLSSQPKSTPRFRRSASSPLKRAACSLGLLAPKPYHIQWATIECPTGPSGSYSPSLSYSRSGSALFPLPLHEPIIIPSRGSASSFRLGSLQCCHCVLSSILVINVAGKSLDCRHSANPPFPPPDTQHHRVPLIIPPRLYSGQMLSPDFHPFVLRIEF